MRSLSHLVCFVLVGCASAAPPTPTTVSQAQPRIEAAATPEPAERAPHRMAIAGLTGSLSAREAQDALDPQVPQFAGCFEQPGTRVRGFGGDVTLHIVVNADGSVRTAFPTDSTVGHRGVERCLSEVAEATRFPRPRGGGEAVLTWPISMDPPPGVRHPTTWDPSRVADVVERNRETVLELCRPGGGGRIQVTAYTRSGRVIIAGAAAGDEPSSAALECVVTRVRTWSMPPARRTAKVTFEL